MFGHFSTLCMKGLRNEITNTTFYQTTFLVRDEVERFLKINWVLYDSEKCDMF